ncbi:MAG: hypothetical protein F4148_04725 [Caldilineaceae bacterium SB0675_bin_29]|uniref:Uncharacterized protein n=1 Tax=Caldilineaceae bacterium SB0675_bin_29 TaxID=2605266 RepID=A0A6B1FYI5_9CHLR|nr:hypothetical protein [Caldilineaceae bacterium SB0675_bin_29]
MAIVPADSTKYTALRVLAVVFTLAIAMGATAVAFYVTDVFGILFRETSANLQLIVLVPASVLAIITTFFAAKILWSASDPAGNQRPDSHHDGQT